MPKRELLSLRTVLAHPNASVIGCDLYTRSSSPCDALDTYRRYCRMKRALSVLPAPDSPEMTSAWLTLLAIIARCDAAATAKMCGGSRSSDMLDLYCASLASS